GLLDRRPAPRAVLPGSERSAHSPDGAAGGQRPGVAAGRVAAPDRVRAAAGSSPDDRSIDGVEAAFANQTPPRVVEGEKGPLVPPRGGRRGASHASTGHHSGYSRFDPGR